MPFKYAYVKYRDSTECEILETDVLENFDESLHLPSKCYWVTVRCSSATVPDLGDHRYKVQILLLAETRAKITDMLEKGTRLKIPKIYDSSISSQEESDVEDETERGQKRDVEGVPKKLKQKTLIVDGAKKKALSAIMKDKLVKRTPFAPFITPPTLPPKTPRPQTPRPQTPRPQTTTKNPRPKPTTNPSSKTPHTQTTTPPTTPRTQTTKPPATTTPPKTPRTQTTTPPATQTMMPPTTPPSSTATIPAPIPAPTNSDQRIQALEQRVRVLEALNVRLQEEILNKFTAGGPGGFVTQLQDSNSADAGFLGLDYQAEDGQISLGHGVSLVEAKYTTVKGSTTNSLFVKNLAIAVWGSETLRDSSLEGKTCPRFKNRPAKQRLDADKLLAVKECFSHHLAGQPLSPSDRKAELAKFKTYIREKMMDLNRRKK